MSYDYIDLLKELSQPQQQTKTTTNINNSTVIIGSNNVVSAYNEISRLPANEQNIAKTLVETLKNCIESKSTPPKNFGKKFGDFVKNYGHLVPAIGSLALELLSTIF